jgi:hypothetical protein
MIGLLGKTIADHLHIMGNPEDYTTCINQEEEYIERNFKLTNHEPLKDSSYSSRSDWDVGFVDIDCDCDCDDGGCDGGDD